MSTTKLLIGGIIYLVLLRIITVNLDYINHLIDTYLTYAILLTLISLLLYRYIIKILLLKTLYQETIFKVKTHIASLYYILLVGAIGSRKSANLTAIAQMTEMAKINDMEDKSYKIRVLLSDFVDFNHLDNFIDQNFNKDIVYHDARYKRMVYDYFKAYSRIYRLQLKVKYESFRTGTLWSILSEYVELYYYQNIRQAHMLTNTTIQSVNTGHNSIPVKESFFQLYRKNDLAHEKYLVIVEDEKGVVDNARVYARLDKKSVQDNDDGKDIHAMLQRHGSKGTNTMLVVSQTEKDVTANRRRLPNRFIEFLKPKDVYIFNIERSFLQFLINRNRSKEYKFYDKKMRKISFNTKLYNLTKKQKYIDKAEKIYHKYHDYLNVFNKYKKRIKRYQSLDIKLGKHLYIIQYAFLHESEENIGQTETTSHVKSSFPISFIYPADITYDRYDSFAYYDVYDHRNKAATTALAKVPKFKDKIMNRQEHERMDYRAINKIYNEIDAQSNTKPKSKEKAPKENNVSYDAF